tara:strand:- start:362 stop:613 length:252 start_codon:yes stop_codon:yes gene_type:complete
MARNRIRRYGTRAEVMNGTARMTQGRLTKADFIYNEKGYIVSKKKSIKMKGDDNPLKKQKYLQTKKGRFGPARRKTKSNRKKK